MNSETALAKAKDSRLVAGTSWTATGYHPCVSSPEAAEAWAEVLNQVPDLVERQSVLTSALDHLLRSNIQLSVLSARLVADIAKTALAQEALDSQELAAKVTERIADKGVVVEEFSVEADYSGEDSSEDSRGASESSAKADYTAAAASLGLSISGAFDALTKLGISAAKKKELAEATEHASTELSELKVNSVRTSRFRVRIGKIDGGSTTEELNSRVFALEQQLKRLKQTTAWLAWASGGLFILLLATVVLKVGG